MEDIEYAICVVDELEVDSPQLAGELRPVQRELYPWVMQDQGEA